MPAKIRLQRHGKKGQPFYHIVIADSRSPRDGKFIEKIGTYNPLTNPAEVTLNFDRALYWVGTGAVPTDTARSLLSRKGVMLKHHLMTGVRKGALTEEQVEVKFQAWLREREAKDANVVKGIEEKTRNERKSRMEAEAKINETRAAEIAKKRLAELEAKKAAAAEAEATEEVPVAEAPAENTEA